MPVLSSCIFSGCFRVFKFFVPPQPMWHYVFELSAVSSALSAVCRVPNIFISLRKNTARIVIKFAGGNH